ncbi:hypothetical protein H9Y05_09155 [Crocinitomicaceae bacterium CZZ-1]|uniref:PH domain-containing protein n=1 Tax=Taishania pollutisoli TaxID=2766479 RepID=A0A8J6TSZ2_9FLAO|nr:hypothetical protein [Taishania pollutisoli]MBC9812637.1 hypothetical protein [Taishania pollutisoli]
MDNIQMDNIQEYKQSLKHHWENAKSVVFYILGLIGFPAYMIYRFGWEDSTVFIRYALIGFSVFLIPQLILHIRYYYINRGYIFYYYPQELKIKIRTTTGEETEFYFDDIKQVYYVKSFPQAENRMQWLATDSYSFARIYLKNGKQFLITSLIIPNMNLPLEKEKIRISKTFYAYPLTKERPLKELKKKPIKEEKQYRNFY